MTAADLLPILSSVHPRSAGKWTARCPAHDDRSPSLSIAEGERGLLLKCFAGCSLGEIVAALGITERDLFFDADQDARSRRRTQTDPKPPRYDWRRTAGQFKDRALDLWLRAERVLAAACGLDSDGWSDQDLDAAMRAVGRGYADLQRADLLEDVAFRLRWRGLASERTKAA